ncbi:pyruvate dehydrogenase complex E1 component subunit beta [Amylibacter sp.]|jgi:pyruvate dehydrogenase E1 component beta subunit|nr:pyruvate dehydrogenase complex E1 component subunit beta [Rhodobacterales bacterium]MDA9585494.1 pyruvate dehydrogenase complex E1 component subunit beta [Amylibacter sp.]MDB2332818.1 pyruvate dehydrogenase complex E1 component subunit beta [Amylibacter sp.]MDC0146246.1 pyruvate dehydrogenase complex E1 component subunit beta [Amylibacter sp.]MDG1216876.1 pyruvate dehydrogenase complex E1 component subunit beta [Amylibacter sp.]
MTINILMPALSPTMEEGTLAKWLVKEGDIVQSGDIMAEIETDKATMEFEAVDEGTIGKILIPEGTENVTVNTAIAILLEDGENLSNLNEVSSPVAADKLEKTITLTENVISKDIIEQSTKISNKYIESELIPDGTTFTPTTVRDALRDAMAEEMRSNDNVFLMGEEVAEYEGAYKVSQGLLDEFGDKRIIDTPITEHGFAGIAVGAAFGGLNPIVEFMTFNFALQAMDHIINSAAKTLYMSGGQMGAPMVFRGPNGAASRVGAQHSHCFAAWYAQIPGLKVVMPYSAADAKGLLKSAIRDPNPVVFLENEMLYGRTFEVPDLKDFTVPIGKAKIWREGSDVTLVSFGIGMQYALEAAELLEADGISAEVIDLRTIRPIDYDTLINSIKKTNRCVTIEEGFPVASIGNHLSAVIMERAFDYLDAPVINCTGKDVPMPYAANLEKLALVTTQEVIEAVKQVTYK